MEQKPYINLCRKFMRAIKMCCRCSCNLFLRSQNLLLHYSSFSNFFANTLSPLPLFLTTLALSCLSTVGASTNNQWNSPIFPIQLLYHIHQLIIHPKNDSGNYLGLDTGQICSCPGERGRNGTRNLEHQKDGSGHMSYDQYY